VVCPGKIQFGAAARIGEDVETFWREGGIKGYLDKSLTVNLLRTRGEKGGQDPVRVWRLMTEAISVAERAGGKERGRLGPSP